ncbi:MAG: cadmium-translocating P-type ATPase [Clostridia bacterium]|nr:cadmium-translocating P-type ATPase [Clostridia bacterium]
MTGKQKFVLSRIILTAVSFVAIIIYAASREINLLIFLIPYLIIGYDVLWDAVSNIFRGHFFDEKFLMSVATIGAIALGEYPEALAVMLFYQTGELFMDIAVNKSRRSIDSLMDIYPEYAVVVRSGKELRCEPGEVAVGEEIIVRPGERIALDGRVIGGTSSVDTSALTGESVPRDVAEGDRVFSGSVNLSGVLRIEVSAEYGDSIVSRILELVESAAEKKAKTENFITRFARVYTPIVVASAVILALIPSLITGMWSDWIHRALMFLVVSCPCALVISVPLSFFGGIGAASKRGILIKGSVYLEQLAKTDVVVFDKTGTLTYGSFDVIEISSKIDKDQLLCLAATAEYGSNHPVARSIRRVYKKQLVAPKNVEEFPGKGVISDGVACGNASLMEHLGIKVDEVVATGTVVYVARDGKYLGHIIVADRVKDNSQEAVEGLHLLGIFTVMLTGDNMAAARAVSDVLGIDEVHSDLLPDTKVAKLEEIEEEVGSEATVCYVGDGINDAPVLATAEVGISMGGMGSDAAIEASDIVLMDDDPAKVAEAIYLSRRTLSIAKQNITLALVVKGIVLLLGALGVPGVGMWAAVFADVGVSVLAVLNAMRCMRLPKNLTAPTEE